LEIGGNVMPNMEQGKSNRVVVEELIRNIRAFNDIVYDEITSMEKMARELNEVWKDEQYHTFYNFIEELSDSLCKDLDVLDDASNKLEEKVKLY
jgi:hypothetical protein